MKKFILLTIFLFQLVLLGYSQDFSKNYWHRGEIDLTSGETLKGEVKYDLENDNLVFKSGNMVRSYNATRVEAWQIVDALTKTIRYFYTLPYSTDGSSYKKPTFFELLSEGEPISLLAKEKVVEKVENTYDPYWFGGRNVRVAVQVDDYYLINGQGQIAHCRPDEDSLMKFMGDQSKVVKKFIKSNKLKIERRADMIQIIDFYNSLINQ
ncbi:hypothetical protein [Flexithrix dorotheae]|uniref:hypothetical protein n=1 Tax=Flexithrix dorotheae TaxID=70993 RepID=UPI0003626B3D|nr:hypothetical protein [Flexithrix dorotheae]